MKNRKAAKKDGKIRGNRGHHRLAVAVNMARGEQHSQSVVLSA